MAIPCGFPTASSMLPNKVEFQWIRCNWVSNNRQVTSLLNVLPLKKAKAYQLSLTIHTWYHMQHKYHKQTTALIRVLCRNVFLISEQKYCLVDCCLSSPALVLTRTTSKETDRSHIDLVAFLCRILWTSMEQNSGSGQKDQNSFTG